jgi:hypothetical protein
MYSTCTEIEVEVTCLIETGEGQQKQIHILISL